MKLKEREDNVSMKNTRGASGGGSIRKRSDGRWEGRYTTGFDPKTGKQIQKSVYGKTQKEVRQKLSKITSEIDEGTYMEPSKETLSNWLDVWLKTYVAHSVKPYTVDSYTRICERHIKPTLGRIKLSKLAALEIQQFYNAMLEEKGLSAKTIKNIHGVLHRALEQAVKLGMIRSNPSDLCDLPKVTKKEIQPLEDNDIARFMEAIQKHKYGLLYQVTLFTGMRQGEVLGLTWDCVDFDTNSIYVKQQLQKTQKVGGVYTLVPTKNGLGRIVVVAPTVMELLKTQKSRQLQFQQQAGPAWDNPWNLVFTNQLGGHLCHCTVYKHFKKVVRDLGLDEERFHDLRHSYALISIESGDDIKTVQSNLGHATSSFTLDVYGHISQKMKQQSADRMEQFIRGIHEKQSQKDNSIAS